MSQERTAKQIITLWETKRDDMLTGDMDTAVLADLVKAAQIGGKTKVKFLGFKGYSKTNKKVLNILAEPSDPYVKAGGEPSKKEERKTSW